MTEAFRYIPNYTVKDYEQWEGDWELWDGHPVAMVPSPGFDHKSIVMNQAYLIRQSLEGQDTCHCKVVCEVDWRIDQHTVVRPDLMVVCEPVKTKWVEVVPTLITEVLSPSNAENDRTYKRRLYAQQGVKYYLIVDPDAKTVDALVLQGDAYAPMSAGDGTLSFDMHDGCAVSLEVAGLWA